MAKITSGPPTFDLPNITVEDEESELARRIIKAHSAPTSETKEAILLKPFEPVRAERTKGKTNSKAVLDLDSIGNLDLEGKSPLFNLKNADKFNVVVPPGKTVTFNFDMKSAVSGSNMKTVVTVANKHGAQPKLISFSFDKEGRPLLRGAIHTKAQSMERKRGYMTHDQMKTYKLMTEDQMKLDNAENGDNPNDNIQTARSPDSKSDKAQPVGLFIDLNDDKNINFSKNIDPYGLKQLHDKAIIPNMTADSARRAKYKAYSEMGAVQELRQNMIAQMMQTQQKAAQEDAARKANALPDTSNLTSDEEKKAAKADKEKAIAAQHSDKTMPVINVTGSLDPNDKNKDIGYVTPVDQKNSVLGAKGENRDVTAKEAANQMLHDLQTKGRNPLDKKEAWKTSSFNFWKKEETEGHDEQTQALARSMQERPTAPAAATAEENRNRAEELRNRPVMSGANGTGPDNNSTEKT